MSQRHWARLTVDDAIRALRKHKGNITHAAHELGCSWPTLQRWSKREPEIGKALEKLRERHGVAASGNLRRVEYRDPKPSKEVSQRDLDDIVAAYMEAKQAVDEIYHVLQLSQLRCRNAAKLRESGLCYGDANGLDACFSSRLNTADARLMAEKLAAKMNEQTRRLLEDPDDDDDDDKEG